VSRLANLDVFGKVVDGVFRPLTPDESRELGAAVGDRVREQFKDLVGQTVTPFLRERVRQLTTEIVLDEMSERDVITFGTFLVSKVSIEAVIDEESGTVRWPE